jgi:hypothetical protein
MAEAVVVVCDTCGQPAAETVSIRAGGKALQKDLCARHVRELLANARPARRGRPRSKSKASATRTKGRKKATTAKQGKRKRAA